MPVDASIYNLSRAAPVADPAQQYLTVAKLAQLQREGQVGDLQLAKLQQEMADDDAVKAFYRGVKPGESPRGRLSELMSVSPKAGMAAQKFYQEADKSQADLLKTDRENMVALLEESRKRLPLIRDDATLAQYRDEAIQRAGMFVTPQFRDIAMRAAQNVPTRFDPAWVQAQVLKAEDLMVPKMKEVDIGGTIQMVDMNPLTNPAIRGQSMTKTMTPGEKDTSARGWASNAETRRHNQATEANAGVSFDSGRGVIVNTRTGTASPVMVGGNEFGGGKPLGADPSKAREDADNLRKEFNALPEVKNFKEVVPIINAAKDAPNTPAGDFALIYGVGKILDPGSVVREGEMSLVIKSGSPAERVKGYLSYLSGNGRLTPTQRAELTSMLDVRVGEMGTAYDAAKTTYKGIAEKRGYSPEDIFTGQPAVKQSKPAASAERVVKDLPDPASHNGYTATDPKSGITYKSDGKRWVRIDG